MFSKRKKKDQLARMASSVIGLQDGTPLTVVAPEVVDSMRYMISRMTREEPLPKRLALVSALHREGTTYLARALAVVLANDLEKNICLVDFNWWWPAQWPDEVAETQSLTAVLNENTPLEEALVTMLRPNLKVLPAGNMPAMHRSAMVHSRKMQTMLDELSEQFDHIIMDVPALVATTDTLPLLSMADGCCLVVHQGVTSIEDVRLVLDDIAHLNILGVVMNKTTLKTPKFILKYIPQN